MGRSNLKEKRVTFLLALYTGSSFAYIEKRCFNPGEPSGEKKKGKRASSSGGPEKGFAQSTQSIG